MVFSAIVGDDGIIKRIVLNSERIQVLRGTGSMGIRTILLTVFKLFFLFFTVSFNVKLNSRAAYVMQCYLMP